MLSGCGGSGGNNAIPSSPIGDAKQANSRGTARFVIAIPARAAASSSRKPAYISPATQSITIALSGPTPTTQTANLTPTSTGCSSTLASTQCTLSVTNLAPGAYTGAISTYDGTNATGNALSSNQNVAFSIVAGQANTVSLTLTGIPHRLVVLSQSAAAAPSGNASFTISGVFPAALLVTALDADGNIIVGPGAPTYNVTQSSGNRYATIGQPTTSAPNTFTLFPTAGNGATATFSIAAQFTDGTCMLSGAVCTTSIATTTHQQTMIVEEAGAVEVYPWPYHAATQLVGYASSFINPKIATFDSNGNFYVSDDNNGSPGYVDEYAPPYTGAPIARIGSGTLVEPVPVVVGPNATLFVGDVENNVVYAYAPPYTGTPLAIRNGVSEPFGLAFDANGDLFVANGGVNLVNEYVAPYTGSPVLLGGLQSPEQVVVSSSNVVFGLSANGFLAAFTPPYGGAPTYLGSSSMSAMQLAPDGSTLFAADGQPDEFDEFKPPYSSVSSQFGSNANFSTGLAFDAANDLFSANQSGNVSIYQPPYAGMPMLVNDNAPAEVFISP